MFARPMAVVKTRATRLRENSESETTTRERTFRTRRSCSRARRQIVHITTAFSLLQEEGEHALLIYPIRIVLAQLMEVVFICFFGGVIEQYATPPAPTSTRCSLRHLPFSFFQNSTSSRSRYCWLPLGFLWASSGTRGTKKRAAQSRYCFNRRTSYPARTRSIFGTSHVAIKFLLTGE